MSEQAAAAAVAATTVVVEEEEDEVKMCAEKHGGGGQTGGSGWVDGRAALREGILVPSLCESHKIEMLHSSQVSLVLAALYIAHILPPSPLQ